MLSQGTGLIIFSNFLKNIINEVGATRGSVLLRYKAASIRGARQLLPLVCGVTSDPIVGRSTKKEKKTKRQFLFLRPTTLHGISLQ